MIWLFKVFVFSLLFINHSYSSSGTYGLCYLEELVQIDGIQIHTVHLNGDRIAKELEKTDSEYLLIKKVFGRIPPGGRILKVPNMFNIFLHRDSNSDYTEVLNTSSEALVGYLVVTGFSDVHRVTMKKPGWFNKDIFEFSTDLFKSNYKEAKWGKVSAGCLFNIPGHP